MGQGEPLHQLVCRLNLIEAIYKKKPARIPRILAVVKQFSDRPGGMDNELVERLLTFGKTMEGDAPLIQMAV